MAGPITWQNVQGRSLAEAAQPLNAAADLFNNAFSGLQGVIKNKELIDTQNFAVQKTNNTQNFLNKIQELGKTPELLQAAIQSGEIDRIREGFGPNIDHAAVRGAAEQLLTQRYAQAKAANDYTEMSASEAGRPYAEQYKVLMQQEKPQEAAAIFNKFKEATGGRGAFDLSNAGENITRVKTADSRATTKFNNENETHAQNILDAKHDRSIKDSNLALARRSLGIQEENAAFNRENQQAVREDRMALKNAALASKNAEAIAGKLKNDGNAYSDGIFNGSQATSLLKFMKDNDIGDTTEGRTAIISNLKTTHKFRAADGSSMEIPIPMSVVNQAIAGAKDPLLSGWNTGWASKVESNIDKIMTQRINSGGKEVIKLEEDYNKYRNAYGLDGAERTPATEAVKIVNGAKVDQSRLQSEAEINADNAKKKAMSQRYLYR